MPTRRQVLSALGAAPLLGPRLAWAAPVERRFVFVLAYGGWDPTRVFVPSPAGPVDVEADAVAASAGGLPFVDHPARPSVRAFFERWHAESLVVNGLLVPSVGHETCLRLVLCGTTAEGAPDWASTLGGHASPGTVLPHLVVDTPAFPGPYGQAVARTGASGQLDGLVDGSILTWSDQAVSPPPAEAGGLVDAYVAGRAAVEADGIRASYAEALSRAEALLASGGSVDWASGTSGAERVSLAVEALSAGLVRCASLPHGLYNWDSHTNNDVFQSANFEDLFAMLDQLVGALHTTAGPTGAPLADDTVVVVLSEMGRTPLLNALGGKDHWPYTSAMVIGPTIRGDRVVGGFDALFNGAALDPETGALAEDGVVPRSDMLGATLLALGGLDPAILLPAVPTIPALL